MHPELGKIFEIENAGNVIDGSITAISALVYATEHFPIEKVYVQGHSLCGAITAAASDYKNKENKVSWPIKSLLNILQNPIEITKYIVKQETGMELETGDLLKPEKKVVEKVVAEKPAKIAKKAPAPKKERVKKEPKPVKKELPKAETTKLTSLSGLGPATAKKFEELGVSCVEELVKEDPAELASLIKGVSEDRIKSWISECKELLQQ